MHCPYNKTRPNVIMEDSSIYSILSLPPSYDIMLFPDMKCDEANVSTSIAPPAF